MGDIKQGRIQDMAPLSVLCQLSSSQFHVDAQQRKTGKMYGMKMEHVLPSSFQ